MTRRPLVIKFGGEALASPARIAAAARRVATRAGHRPVIVVASARRGVTDHLLRLVEEVTEAVAGTPGRPALPETDRVVSTGEVVAASLLALALTQLGLRAVALDARDAGLVCDGRVSRARLVAVRPQRLRRLLRAGVIPVVTGFQGWHRGRVATLGRGGSDTSAVAIAASCRAVACEMVKDTPGLRTADPKVVPHSATIPLASHQLVTQLAEGGAKVIHLRAATLAQRQRVPLLFSSLEHDRIETRVGEGTEGFAVRAVALQRGVALLAIRLDTERAQLLSEVGSLLGEAGLGGDAMVTAYGHSGRLEVLVDEKEDAAALALLRAGLPPGAVLDQPIRGLAGITLTGSGLGSDPTVAGRLYALAAAVGAGIVRAAHSETRIRLVVSATGAGSLVQAIHDGLVAGHQESDPTEDAGDPMPAPVATDQARG